MRYVLLVLAAMTLLAFSGKDKKYADLKEQIVDHLAKGKYPTDSVHFISVKALTEQELILQGSEHFTFRIKDDSNHLSIPTMFLENALSRIHREKEGSTEYKETAEDIAKYNSEIQLIENKIAAYKTSRDSCIASAKTADNRKIIGHSYLVFVRWKYEKMDLPGTTMRYLFLNDRLLTSWSHPVSFPN